MCSLRLACNGRRRNPQTQEWEDPPNYFDVTVWGAQGENCPRYLSKGRAVAVDGRLQWREWTDQERQQAPGCGYQSPRPCSSSAGAMTPERNGNGFSSSARAAESDVPIDTGDFERTPVGAAGADDDIPF